MSTLFLCAAGNPEGVRLALEVNAHEKSWERIVVLDDDVAKQGSDILGVPVIGGFDALSSHQEGDQAVNLVARSTAGRNGARKKIESYGIKLVSLVHPSIDLSYSTVGRALTIYEGCTVSALSTIGDHSVIFTQAVLGHGATLGQGAVLAPGAVINARVQVGARAYVGTNATVLPDLSVGEGATVSACSAVVGDVPENGTMMGVPAELINADPDAETSDTQVRYSFSQDDILRSFALVLRKPDLSAEDNFFDFGGSSKRALDLDAELQRSIGIRVPIVEIFRFPKPRQLADHLLDSVASSVTRSRATLRRQQRVKRA